MKDGSKNSYPLVHMNDLIDSPRWSTSECEEISLKSKAERLNKILIKNDHVPLNTEHDIPLYSQLQSPSGHEGNLEGCVMPLEVHRKTFEPAMSPSTLTNELYKGEVSQAHPIIQEQIPDHVEESSWLQESPHQDLPENIVCQEIVSPVQSGHSPQEDERAQDGEVLDQERTSRTVMKKIYGGRIDNDGKCYLRECLHVFFVILVMP